MSAAERSPTGLPRRQSTSRALPVRPKPIRRGVFSRTAPT